jgi:diacylglycerol kinase
LEDNSLILLLDGLDEVRREERAACVVGLNLFQKRHGLTRLVVCSRSTDYDAIGVKLQLHGAVRLLPFTAGQVQEYLTSAGIALAGLRLAIKRHSALRTLAQTPLMLSIMSAAYADRDVEYIVSRSFSSHLDELFASYVNAMFDRVGRTRNQRFTAFDTKRWLASLSRCLLAHDRAQLLLEDIRTDWLTSKFLRELHTTLWVLVCASLLGVPVALSWGWAAHLVLGWNRTLSSVAFGVPAALAVWCAFRWEFGLRGQLTVGASYGALMGIACASANSLRVVIVVSIFGGLVTGLGFGQLVGKMFAVRHLQMTQVREHLRTVDKLSWSWRSARQGLVSAGVPVGLAVCLVVMLSSLLTTRLRAGLADGFLIGIGVACTCGLLLGFTPLDIPKKTRPNQGIWMSLRNAFVSGILASLVSGLPVALVVGQTLGFQQGVSVFVAFASHFGIGSALVLGGAAFIGHFIVRVLLWLEGSAPLHYVQFLDYACERVFLQKVGGAYIFVHRLLLEFFARSPRPSMPGDPRERATRSSSEWH